MLCLAAILAVSFVAYGRPAGLEQYAGGGEGRFQCVPPYRPPSCAEVPDELDAFGQSVWAVCQECSEKMEDKSSLQKFVLAMSLLVAWHPAGAALAKAAWSDVPFDVVECLINGLTRVSAMHPEEAAEIRRLITGLNTLRDAGMDVIDVTEWFDGVERMETVARAWEAWELGTHCEDVEEILATWDLLSNFFSPGEMYQHLWNAQRLSRVECEFDLAEAELDQAETALRKYCLWRGYEYRKREAILECYRRRYALYLKHDTLQARKYRDMQYMLRLRENSLVQTLEVFHDIERERGLNETRRRAFANLRANYLGTALVTAAALRREDLKTACHGVVGLQELKKRASRNCLNCPDKVVPDLDEWEDRVFEVYWGKVQEVEDVLRQARSALSQDATESARDLLSEARQALPDLLSPQGGTCSEGLDVPRILGMIEELEAQLAPPRETAVAVDEYVMDEYAPPVQLNLETLQAECPCPPPSPGATLKTTTYETYHVMPKGAKVGLYQRWFDEGRTRLYRRWCYQKNGKRHGPHITWRRNPHQVEKFYCYKNGKLNGPFMRWYPNGQIVDRGTYKNGLNHGLYESFNQDGSPAYRVTYKEGKRHGKEYSHNRWGTVRVRIYRNGELIRTEE